MTPCGFQSCILTPLRCRRQNLGNQPVRPHPHRPVRAVCHHGLPPSSHFPPFVPRARPALRPSPLPDPHLPPYLLHLAGINLLLLLWPLQRVVRHAVRSNSRPAPLCSYRLDLEYKPLLLQTLSSTECGRAACLLVHALHSRRSLTPLPVLQVLLRLLLLITVVVGHFVGACRKVV
mgnify:CR=1 FL=1